MLSVEQLPLGATIGLFVFSALLIAWAGTRIVPPAETIAARSGLGQAIFGAVFIGMSTSLSGSLLSVYTAAIGHVDMAIGNAIGGIAAQTAFLAIGDLTLPRRNLEHAAASLQNLAQGSLLVILLAIPILESVMPSATIAGVSLATPVLVMTYALGLRLVAEMKNEPMWSPRVTKDTVREPAAEEMAGETTRRAVARFAVLILVLAVAGLLLAEASVAIVGETGLSETLFGSVFTAVCTSLPELITMLVAIHRHSLNLAVGNIIGGNSFDVLFLAGADVAHREGSIYAHFKPDHIGITCVSILMTAVLLLGMLRRERRGVGSIGFESAIVLGLYMFMIVTLVL